MLKFNAFLLLVMSLSGHAQVPEGGARFGNGAVVESMVVCESSDKIWLCAAFEEDQLQLFRSEFYRGKVEVSEPLNYSQQLQLSQWIQALSAAIRTQGTASAELAETPTPQGYAWDPDKPRYTLELGRCRMQTCRQWLDQLDAIPETQRLSAVIERDVYELVVLGAFKTVKAAEQAAGNLMLRYHLTTKPQIHTLDYLRYRKL